ncbi:TPA: prepilin-type N-terminal cleavage/methylation domain-containing protein [Candidatus Poribacteria bacterium]|nr:prepilin-type N-terminal cleavage/methylation domain-containing protein [Candidatus Poribacteria bacterium]
MRGFTLIELMAVMVIVAVVMAVLIPRFSSDVLGKMKSYSAARRIASYLLYTRSLAINTSRDHKVDFIPSEGTFERFEIWKEFEGGWTKVEEGDLPEDVNITGDSQFTFQPLGGAVSGGEIHVIKGEYHYVVAVDPIIGRIEVREE